MSNVYNGVSCDNSYMFLAVNCFFKKISQMFDWVVNTPLNTFSILIQVAATLWNDLFVSGFKIQKQPSRGVPRKRCPENMEQISRKTTMPKCDFNKVALLKSHFSMGVLVEIRSIFSKCLFLETTKN